MTTVSPDVQAGYEAGRRRAGAVQLDRDVVRVVGPDATSYLQGQLSQDVGAFAVGETGLTFLLQPTGKVVALARVTRVTVEEFLLDTDGGAGAGEAIVERLARFKMRTKADIELLAGWGALGLRGPDHDSDLWSGKRLAVDASWPGLQGIDLLGEGSVAIHGATPIPADAWEALRIEAGIPVMGREIDERTIPAELGAAIVARAVSFTKGCYTGQELVARMDSRVAAPPRSLVGVVFAMDGPPAVAGEAPKVEVTSVAWSPGLAAGVALAFLPRSVALGPVTVEAAGVARLGEARSLPLVS